MRFALSEEQVEFSQAVRGLLADTCGPEAVRAAWPDAELAGGGPGGGNGRVPRAWSALGEMGVLGITVPESSGGLGMTYEDLSPLLVEAGRFALPDPLSSTAGVAVAALVSALGAVGEDRGTVSDGRIVDLLGAIAAGESSVGVVFTGASLVASDLVAGAASLDLVIAFTGDEVLVIDSRSLRTEAVESVDGARCLARVTWGGDGVGTLLVGTTAASVTASSFNLAALGTSAELLGLSRTMIEMAVAYATERRQFGVPIGSFQAVKHQLADAALQVEFCEPLIMRAAHSIATGSSETSRDVSMAKSKISTAAQQAAATSLQVHGAIGYTVECDLHLYMKRAWALSREYGDSDTHRARVRAHLLESAV